VTPWVRHKLAVYRAWLLTVARNMIIDESRSSRFRNEVSVHESADVAGCAGADEMDAAVDRMLIAEAFARLSAEHRAVIWRCFYLTWTTAQIAQDLHIPKGTVKSRLHAAMRELRLIGATYTPSARVGTESQVAACLLRSVHEAT
jgi:RNA polymerase sigma-70 factor (ECF subfamily)